MRILHLVLLLWLLAGLAGLAQAQKTIADYTFKQP